MAATEGPKLCNPHGGWAARSVREEKDSDKDEKGRAQTPNRPSTNHSNIYIEKNIYGTPSPKDPSIFSLFPLLMCCCCVVDVLLYFFQFYVVIAKHMMINDTRHHYLNLLDRGPANLQRI